MKRKIMKKKLLGRTMATVLSAVMMTGALYTAPVYADEDDEEHIYSEENTEEKYEDVTLNAGESVKVSKYLSYSASSYDYKSGSKSVAYVDDNYNIIANKAGYTTITAVSQSEIVYISVTVEGAAVPEQDTVYKDIDMKVGDGLDTESYLTYDPSEYKWSSSNSSVASVQSQQYINANSAGYVTITAKSDREIVYFSVTVTGGKTSAETRNVTMYVDDTKDLSGYVSSSASKYDWSSSDKSIVTVSSSGKVTAKKKGSAEITVYKSGSEAYIFYITVKNSSSSSSSSSSSYNEKYTIYMGRDDSVDISDYLAKSASNYDWETSDKEVCKVSGSKIKAVDSGSATVKALGSKNYQFNVKVNKNYSNYAVSLKVDDILDLEKYLDDAVSKYNISYYETGIAKVEYGELVGKKNGTTYVIFENKNSNEIVQLMVEVSGTAATTKTTTTERTTEATTSEPVTAAPSTPSTPAVPDKGFKDISHRQWAVAAINNMAAKGYINGRSATVFAPDDNCSKADFTIVLTKMLGIENDDYAGGFDDVSSDKYYAKYVNVARQYGICAGVVNNTFKPQSAITREEVMYMVYMGLKLKGRDLDTDTSALSTYSDAYKVDSDYKVAVAALLNEGIVAGVSDTEIDPKATITRAQMAVLLNNLGM